MRKLCVLVASLALPLVLAATAGANTIQRESFSFDETFVQGVLTQACGLEIVAHQIGTGEVADYFDNDGVLLKETERVTSTITYTNPANGKTVSSRRQFSIITTYNPDGSVQSTAQSGLFLNDVAPSVGAILQGLGRRVFDGEGHLIFSAGPADIVNQNFDAFCAYMADP